MLEQRDIIADLHIHTLGSGHAYSTLKECIDVAENNGMKYIAITDHYYGDGTILDKKNEVNRIAYLERKTEIVRDRVKVIGGAEFNIAHNVSSWEKLKKLKWKIIGLHGWFLNREETSLSQLYEYFENAALQYNAFAHIERELHKIDHCKYGSDLTEEIKDFFCKIVLMAKKTDTVLELNEASLSANESGAYERIRFWLMKAKENNNIISLGTDAHYCEEVGVFKNSVKILNEVNFPKDNIINCNENLIKRYLG